jgi:hypothetical protein
MLSGVSLTSHFARSKLVLSVNGSAEMNITSVVCVVGHHVHLLTVSMQQLEKKMV